jgi:hypothetical protein
MSGFAKFMVLVAAVLVVSAPTLVAQGITTKGKAVVLYGSPSNTTKPATINYETVRKKTPEYQTIRSEGVRKGSARYELLTSRMGARIREAAGRAAQSKGVDCVVRSGDIANDNGITVVDLTGEVVAELESGDPAA